MDVSLITDWLGREGGDLLRWWLLVTLAGVGVWPLLFRVMGALPDRGYTLARAAGLMLTGFIFWFMASLGLLRNTPASMVFAWLVVATLSLVVILRWENRPALRPWLREHWPLIVLTEVLFAVLLVGWAAYRAHNPEMGSTEKPMEIMFVNAIRASETFPPRDAWLSGYAISYYYFGYVIIAMLADLSSLSSGVAFNIMIALIFALTGIGALGVVYNLVRSGAKRVPGATRGAALAAGVLGMCFLILMGNLGTALVEFPYRGYTPGLVNAAYFDFWDLEGRTGTEQAAPVDADGDGVPNWDDDKVPLDRWDFWSVIGWRYSRVVHDRDLTGTPQPVQPITEFPQFSFVLSDLHPHVLALPFAVLAIGLALNLVLGGRELRNGEIVLYAIWVGGMVFMNSWDAIYLPLLVGAETLRRLLRNGNGVLHRHDLIGIGRFALVIGGLALLLYLPWIISFTSQAGGVLPNVVYPTPWQQFFLQFGTFLVVLTVFVLVEVRRAGWRFHAQAGLLAVTLAVGVLVLALVVLGFSAWGSEIHGNVFTGAPHGASLGDVLPDILERRLVGLPTEIWLLVLICAVVGRLFVRPAVMMRSPGDGGEQGERVRVQHTINYNPATGFALLLIGAGAVLTLAPDFVYLRDNFAVRINTVFKLYYQGWIMFSVAAAFGTWSVLAGGEAADHLRARRRVAGLRVAFASVLAILFAAGMLYPVLATRGRALVETGRLMTKERRDACERGEAWAGDGANCPELAPLTLDGAPSMVPAGEYEAIQCLAALEPDGEAVLVEAPGGAYEPHKSRFSGLTGIPTLIGWQNHERQWRGATYPAVTDFRIENGERRDRAADVQELYITEDWARAWQIIDRYGIDYIVVGGAERAMIRDLASEEASRESDPAAHDAVFQQRLWEYERGLFKFEQVLTPVCAYDGAVVYRVSPE